MPLVQSRICLSDSLPMHVQRDPRGEGHGLHLNPWEYKTDLARVIYAKRGDLFDVGICDAVLDSVFSQQKNLIGPTST